jgi:ligand-binding sensor domain-containing protein/serine phosphatase RsbU (regulator of sigma subunit)
LPAIRYYMYRDCIILLCGLLMFSCETKSEENTIDNPPDKAVVSGNLRFDSLDTGVELACSMKLISIDSVETPTEWNFDEITEVYSSQNVDTLQDGVIFPYSDSILVEFQDSLVIQSNAIGSSSNERLQAPIQAEPFEFMESAKYDVQFMDVDEGLNSSYIWDIIEDKRGNIWIATHDAGVAKFDGHEFTYFTTEQGLCDNSIRDMIEDKKGQLWFASNGSGVSVFDGKKFTNYSSENGLENDMIESLFEDSKGNVWLGTNGSGVIKFDGNNFMNYNHEVGFAHPIVRAMGELDNGDLWFGTWGDGIVSYDWENFKKVTIGQGSQPYHVRDLMNDQNGNLWVANFYGSALLRFNGNDFERFTDENGLIQNSVNCIAQDENDNIWLGTEGGISIINGENVTHLTKKEGLRVNAVRSLLVDSFGGIWLGTWGGGVQYIRYPSFNHFTDENGLLNNHITSISQDDKGVFWMSSHLNGLIKYDTKKFTYHQSSQNNALKGVLCTHPDNNGNVWFGAINGGLNKFDGQKVVNYLPDQGLSAYGVFVIKEDLEGNLWMGTNGGGVCKFNGAEFSHLTEEEGLTDDIVRALEIDKNGVIWIGTWSMGICKFDGNKITYITPNEGLSGKRINTLKIDDYGKLWIGTDAGIDQISVNKQIVPNQDNFFHLNVSNGLSNNNILGLETDVNGDLWATSKKGLIKISISDSEYQKGKQNIPPIRTFVKNDGLVSSSFYINSLCITKNNDLWAGSSRSLVHYNIDDGYLDTICPNANLNYLDIDGSFVDYNLREVEFDDITFDGVAQYYNYPKGLELPYYRNHLTFHFNAANLNSSHTTEYSFILEGQKNANWSIPSKKRVADYRNLDFADYTFKIKARGANKIWGKVFEYRFTIKPPWWRTPWAYSSYVLILLFLISGLVRWRTHKLRRRQVELESQVEIATTEIREQKEAVEKQKDVIEEAHQEIKDSITYAKRIQTAILPPLKIVKQYLEQSFILYKPKDVVAGDFYWMEHKDDTIFFAAADCTGHGVPGAMVSVICNNGLNRSVREYGLSNVGKILDKTREIVISEFEKSEEVVKDGMDVALCSLNGLELNYSGAHNPLWVIRKGVFTADETSSLKNSKIEEANGWSFLEIKADKQPIGRFMNAVPFTAHTINLKKEDTIYLFSDGYADQFGGEKGKKYKAKALKELLIQIQDLSMDEQQLKLDEVFETWKGDLEQLDDVCIIGVRV